MLIAALEGPGDIYDIPLDGSQPTVELHTLNYLSTQIGAWSGYVIAAYNDMVAYPGSGTKKRPDLLIGLGVLSAANYPGAWQGMYPNPTFLVRHANGSYDFQVIDSSAWGGTWCLSTRAMIASAFPGDPAGTLYTGGYDAHNVPAHNTDWIYRGIPK